MPPAWPSLPTWSTSPGLDGLTRDCLRTTTPKNSWGQQLMAEAFSLIPPPKPQRWPAGEFAPRLIISQHVLLLILLVQLPSCVTSDSVYFPASGHADTLKNLGFQITCTKVGKYTSCFIHKNGTTVHIERIVHTLISPYMWMDWQNCNDSTWFLQLNASLLFWYSPWKNAKRKVLATLVFQGSYNCLEKTCPFQLSSVCGLFPL